MARGSHVRCHDFFEGGWANLDDQLLDIDPTGSAALRVRIMIAPIATDEASGNRDYDCSLTPLLCAGVRHNDCCWD